MKLPLWLADCNKIDLDQNNTLQASHGKKPNYPPKPKCPRKAKMNAIDIQGNLSRINEEEVEDGAGIRGADMENKIGSTA